MSMAVHQPDIDEPETQIEVRCPVGARRLFAKMIQRGERPSFVHPDNLIEFSCYDCRQRLIDRGESVRRVLHRYDIAGKLITTLIQR